MPSPPTLFAILIAIIAGGCSQIESVVNKTPDGVLVERFDRRKDNLTRHGKYESYYPNGQVKEICFFANDTLHGQRTFFFENGVTDFIENYDHGSFEGVFQKFYPSGQLSNEGTYHQNKMSGVWKRWYESGELWEAVHFEDNNENGPYKIYHKNGQVAIEGTFIWGENDHGEVRKYDDNGQLTDRMFCHWGVCATTWKNTQGDIQIDTQRIVSLGELTRETIEKELQ